MNKSFLDRIVARKKAAVALARRRVPESALLQIKRERPMRSLKAALAVRKGEKIRIIAEIKRASPSKGVFAANLNAGTVAGAYETAGAAALSVLTDKAFFNGDLKDLSAAAAAVRIPVLRKDFIVSTYQIIEAAGYGADAVLLIARILERRQIEAFLAVCREMHLEALVEVHSHDDLEKTAGSAAELIGINNRDLKTFTTDLQTAIRLAPCLEAHQLPIVASGIRRRADIDGYLAAGLNAFLIGEALMRNTDPGAGLRCLLRPDAPTGLQGGRT